MSPAPPLSEPEVQPRRPAVPPWSAAKAVIAHRARITHQEFRAQALAQTQLEEVPG